MDFTTTPHRHGDTVLREPAYAATWDEIQDVLRGITDTDLIQTFSAHYQGKNKSLSTTINDLIYERMVDRGWTPEAKIFGDPTFNRPKETRWRLDFAKGEVSVEVAFNHGEATAWNLLKPTLASEMNHVKKEIQTRAGVVIFATEGLKKAGGFDGAIDTSEQAERYLKALHSMITVPMVLIGLEAPKTFKIQHYKVTPKKKLGRIVML